MAEMYENKTASDLKGFLAKLVGEEKISVKDGLYSVGK